MSNSQSDALVFFGATGDLAYKKIFPSLQAMVKRGNLNVPVIGVAKAGWNLGQLRARAQDSLEKHGGIDRPAFDKLCRDAARREFDLVMAWSVDRLGRSLQDLVGFLSELHALKIDLFLRQQGLDTTTPAGKAMFQMMGVFAEFERAMIVERVNSGLARAKAKGVKLGRGNKKDGERSADERGWGMSRAELEKRILRLYKGGTGIVKIGKTLGIGTGLVQRVVTEQPRPFDVAEAYTSR